MREGRMERNMENLTEIDEYYDKVTQDLSHYIPDGLVQISLETLKDRGLVTFYSDKEEPPFTRYFHLVESPQKITLINEQFIVWIVPEKTDDAAFTYVLIALNLPEEPHLEIAFSVQGVFNTSRLVLKLLESYLSEIQEVEESLRSFG